MSVALPQPPPPITANLSASGLTVDLAALGRALERLPADAPVVVLIHGYRFQPGRPAQCPHRHILSCAPEIKDGREISWPQHLALDGQQGLAIALGWPAGGNLWSAYRQAARAGAALAAFAEQFHQIAPTRSLNVVAHSLGTRVALTALGLAAPGRFRQMIFLCGAETRSLARKAMASPAGQSVEVINVTSRENDLYDAAFEWLLHFGRHWSIGQGLGGAGHGLAGTPPNWHDLWIDQRQSLQVLAQSGFPLTAPAGRISHWSPYLRPGAFALYRAVLRGHLPLSALPKALPTRRWSLLFSRRIDRAPLGIIAGQAIP